MLNVFNSKRNEKQKTICLKGLVQFFIKAVIISTPSFSSVKHKRKKFIILRSIISSQDDSKDEGM